MNYRKHTIEVMHDDYVESPREWDNLGTLAVFHNHYNFGDQGHGIDSSDYKGWSEMEAAIRREKDVAVILPVYMLDHSGITISTSPFSCPWDSGQVGFIWISKEKARAEYGWRVISKKRKEQLQGYLMGEIETLDEYLTGNVHGYVIKDAEGEELDACWGYFGDPETSGLMEDAKRTIDAQIGSIGEQLELELT